MTRVIAEIAASSREVADDAEALCKRVEPFIYSREIALEQYLRVNSRVIVNTETSRFF